mmetsp:Transcript_6139/g.38128  ORF Transcript_6139/g.38128 Transcript_6139/m.38128 type:complete len:228 (-) Transcript_6139:314-997(-)
MEDVCWPANRTAMSIPVISSSVSALPFLYFASMKACNTSGSDTPDSRRALITFANILPSSTRALSLRLWAGMGSQGLITLMGCMPMSKSWKSRDTLPNRCSRTSRPKSVRLAVMMIRSESSFNKSTSPLSPHPSKYFSASSTICPTYMRRRLDLSESAKNRNCSNRTLLSTSNTTPRPKVGMLNSYTSFWLRLSSSALKKLADTCGPIKKVILLWSKFKVNTSPYFL